MLGAVLDEMAYTDPAVPTSVSPNSAYRKKRVPNFGAGKLGNRYGKAKAGVPHAERQPIPVRTEDEDEDAARGPYLFEVKREYETKNKYRGKARPRTKKEKEAGKRGGRKEKGDWLEKLHKKGAKHAVAAVAKMYEKSAGLKPETAQAKADAAYKKGGLGGLQGASKAMSGAMASAQGKLVQQLVDRAKQRGDVRNPYALAAWIGKRQGGIAAGNKAKAGHLAVHGKAPTKKVKR